MLKLQNVYHKVRLHSHDVKYGSGSGQQSVTGTEVKEDVNSHWAIKGTVMSQDDNIILDRLKIMYSRGPSTQG